MSLNKGVIYYTYIYFPSFNIIIIAPTNKAISLCYSYVMRFIFCDLVIVEGVCLRTMVLILNWNYQAHKIMPSASTCLNWLIKSFHTRPDYLLPVHLIIISFRIIVHFYVAVSLEDLEGLIKPISYPMYGRYLLFAFNETSVILVDGSCTVRISPIIFLSRLGRNLMPLFFWLIY